MKITEIAFSGYPVTDLARARKFYEGILGLKPSLVNEEIKWVEYDLGGTTFGIGTYPQWKPSSDGPLVAFEVDDFNGAMAKLKEAKVSITLEPMETPVCHIAIVHDPDKNSVMIHKRKPDHG
jgi:predicted enzyme related to lactoylglutathione lyase